MLLLMSCEGFQKRKYECRTDEQGIKNNEVSSATPNKFK
jgi:hypothetical protein